MQPPERASTKIASPKKKRSFSIDASLKVQKTTLGRHMVNLERFNSKCSVFTVTMAAKSRISSPTVDGR